MIVADCISKKFKLYRSPVDRLKEIVTKRNYHTNFQALSEVSLMVKDGATLGIIGQNGAGKSTLLKILTGILLPDSGRILVNGKITGLLELGTGFNAEMTGIENIYMNGTLLGMTHAEIDGKRDAIIEFTELGGFVFEQLKTYSSGMTMRLAFAIAIHADPNCFVVDEALSVGDIYFQQKCMRKISEFKNKGGSIILVSHDLVTINSICDSALLLDKGRVVEYGLPKDCIDYYQGKILQSLHSGDSNLSVGKRLEQIQDGEMRAKKGYAQVNSGDIEIVFFGFCNEDGKEIGSLTSEDSGKIIYSIRTQRDLEDPHYGVSIRNKLGLSVFNTNTYCMGVKNRPLKKGDTVKVTFEMKFNISPDTYSICIGVANKGFDQGSFKEYLVNYIDAGTIKVLENMKGIRYGGLFNMHPKVVLGYET
jgi:ABC-type polysaccharide/polyol phosphate transport system ATPase subunit